MAELGADQARVVVRAGSAYDPPNREGLAFLTAHALAAQVPGASVEVGEEIVRFTLPLAGLATLGRAMDAAPPADALMQARDEASRAQPPATCDEAARQAWALVRYAGHPYGHLPTGRASVLPTVTALEVQQFIAARYVREALRVATGAPPGEDALTALTTRPARLSRSTLPAPLPTRYLREVTVRARLPEGADTCSHTAARVPLAPRPLLPDLLAPALAGASMTELRSEGRTATADLSPAEALRVRVLPAHAATAASEESASARVVSLEDLLR
jgi:hypothetical protein